MAPCTVTAGRPKCATTWLLTVWAAFAVSACRASVAYRLLLATPLWSELRFISSLVLLHMAPGCRCRQSPTGCDRCLVLQPGACRAFQFCAGHGCPVRGGIALVCVAHAWCHFGHRPSRVCCTVCPWPLVPICRCCASLSAHAIVALSLHRPRPDIDVCVVLSHGCCLFIYTRAVLGHHCFDAHSFCKRTIALLLHCREATRLQSCSRKR